MTPDPIWLTLTEAQQHAQISKRTLQRWERQGLPIRRVGGVVRINRRELDAFIAGGGQAAAADVESPVSARRAEGDRL